MRVTSDKIAENYDANDAQDMVIQNINATNIELKTVPNAARLLHSIMICHQKPQLQTDKNCYLNEISIQADIENNPFLWYAFLLALLRANAISPTRDTLSELTQVITKLEAKINKIKQTNNATQKTGFATVGERFEFEFSDS